MMLPAVGPTCHSLVLIFFLHPVRLSPPEFLLAPPEPATPLIPYQGTAYAAPVCAHIAHTPTGPSLLRAGSRHRSPPTAFSELACACICSAHLPKLSSIHAASAQVSASIAFASSSQAASLPCPQSSLVASDRLATMTRHTSA